jgi:hypothetical protein
MCSIYENIGDEAFIGRKQDFVLMFQVNFLGLGFLSSFFIFVFIYIHI